ncbi:MAG: ABC transporter substrate-binding protein [Candidatus Tectomicrobia bacterium]|nr:ABC transporter substrate-binding protein [Candidatus Tectomicrobia bacterium]
MRSGKSPLFRSLAVWTAPFLIFASALTVSSEEKSRVILKNDWLHTPKVAAIFLAREKGWFAAEGIDLDFQDGRGSVANFQLMGAKKLLFATGDAATGATFISQGLAVKIVWGYFQTSPLAVIYRQSSGIRTPKDLEGKRVSRAAAGAGEAIFPAMAERNQVNLSKIQFVNTTPAARYTVLIQGDVDAMIGFFPNDVPFVRSKGAKVDFLRYADFGVNTLGTGIAVHNSVLTERADTLRGLLRAVARGVQYTLNHREEALAALKKQAPLSMKDPKAAREVLDAYLSLLRTKHTQGKPLGWMAQEDWEETIGTLTRYGGLKNPLSVNRYYTNDFVSPDIM